MDTYVGNVAGSKIRPLLENAKESIWIVSPWIGQEYAELLSSISRKGIKVNLITSNDSNNLQSLKILNDSKNPNLDFLILEKVHAKIYVADKKFGISGSANLTYTGMNNQTNNLSIAETEEEIQQMKSAFMELWLENENRGVSVDSISSGNFHFIKNALPITATPYDFDQPIFEQKALVYSPYFFFEFDFSASEGSQHFKDSGFFVVDGGTREIRGDNFLVNEIKSGLPTDYQLDTKGKYNLRINQPRVSFGEAERVVQTAIINNNTKRYDQTYIRQTYRGTYRNSYPRTFVPKPWQIRFIRSFSVQVPVWHLTMHEPDGLKHEKSILASSGGIWEELVWCPVCGTKILKRNATTCENCGKIICPSCVQHKSFWSRKRLCPSCLAYAKLKT